MEKISFIYLTCGNVKEAKEISRKLVAEKLAACTNILPQMTSIYEWEGELREENEVVVIIKTRAELFEKVEAKIKSLHSYKNPCIVSIELNNASAAFLQWVNEQTTQN